MTGEQMQIGEVSERTGLSLRTIRHYEEVGLVAPSTRSKGGFRLYDEADVDRLHVVKRMKPLEFTLEEMADILGLLASLDGDQHRADRQALVDRLEMYREATAHRVDALRQKWETADRFAEDLNARLRRPVSSPALRRHQDQDRDPS